MKHVMLFGISGGIGSAMLVEFLNRFKDITIYTPTREKQDLSTYDLTNGQSIVHMDWDSNDESSFEAIAAHLKTSEIRLDFCVAALGALHSEDHKPEKKLGQITKDQMMWYYNVNAILHSIIIKHFSSLMNKNEPSIMGLLSARVGSISDNKLGGWYSYRAAKAALNMIIKTASIEMKRYNKQLSIIGIHPGTVDTNLSKPFQHHIPEQKLFTPAHSITSIFENIFLKITAEHSGNIYAYDGNQVPE